MAPWTTCAVAVGVAAFCAPQETPHDDLLALLRGGRAGEVVERLANPAARGRWVADPRALAWLCEGAAASLEDLATAGKDGDNLVSILDEMASECVTAGPESADALRARAYAGLAWALRRASPDRPGFADRWSSVARDFQEAHDKGGPGAELLRRAAYALTRAAEGDAAPVPSFQAADALLARVLEGREKDPATVAGVVAVWLEQVRVLATRRRPAAEEVVERALRALGIAEKEHPRDPCLATARNEVACRVRLLRLQKPAVDFAASPRSVGAKLVADFPDGLRWSEAMGPRAAIVQTSGTCREVRHLTFTEYDWDTPHTVGDRQDVKGANIKGIAEHRYAEACASIREVSSRVPVRRATLKRCNPGWYFEVAGRDARGTFRRHRAWYFKSTCGQLVTFELAVTSFREDEPEDPEFQFVLDSIREVDRK